MAKTNAERDLISMVENLLSLKKIHLLLLSGFDVIDENTGEVFIKGNPGVKLTMGMHSIIIQRYQNIEEELESIKETLKYRK